MTMDALDSHLVHLAFESGRAVTGAAVGAGPDQEVRTRVVGGAKQFVDVALAVPDVDAAAGFTKKRVGLLEIEQPTQTLFLLDGDARGVDLSLQRVRALELGARPKLHRRQAERQPRRCEHQAGMQRYPAQLMRLAPTVRGPVLGCVQQADVLAPIREPRGVVQNQDRAARSGEPLAGAAEVPGQDVLLGDAFVGEKRYAAFVFAQS